MGCGWTVYTRRRTIRMHAGEESFLIPSVSAEGLSVGEA